MAGIHGTGSAEKSAPSAAQQQGTQEFQGTMQNLAGSLNATGQGQLQNGARIGGQGGAQAGGGAGTALVNAGLQNGALRISGPQAQETAQMLASLADANPQFAGALQQRFSTADPLIINTQDSGGPRSGNVGNSQVNAIGGSQVLLDFGDESITRTGDMSEVLAHEILHTFGMTHGTEMFNLSTALASNALRMESGARLS